MRAPTLHGRDLLLDALRESLSRPTRLTLLGPGGVGKTRLAEALVAQLPEARWVTLTDATTADEVVRAIANELDLDGDRLQAVLGMAPLSLLVLDNCEQLDRDAVAWLDRSLPPSCSVVATSRHALGWADEQPIEVPALDTQAAIQVFLDAAPRPFAEAHGDRHATLQRVLERLEGLPLALRLAAGRLDVVDLDTLEQLLGERYLTVLADPDDMGRHGSVDRAVAASWNPLDEGRRTALLTCSALGGPFDLEAASAVLQDPLDDLHALSRRHLVEVHAGQYRVPEHIRQFALRQLDASPQAAAIWNRVDAWWAERARAWARTLTGPGHAATLEAAGRSWSGLTRLIGHGADLDARRAFSVLAVLVQAHGPASEGIRWAGTLAMRETSPEARAEALAWRSLWHRRTGAVDEAEADADAAIGFADHGDPGARARMERAGLRLQRGPSDAASRRAELEEALTMVEGPALRANLLANHALALHDVLPHESAQFGTIDAVLAQAQAIAEQTGCPAVQLQVHAQAGTIHLERAVDAERTQHHLQRALDLATTLGRRRKQGILLGQLALAVESTDPTTAMARYDRAVRYLREAGDPVVAATWMGMRSRTELLTGDPARARRDLQACLGWLERGGDGRIRWHLLILLAAEAAARGDLERLATYLEDTQPSKDKEKLIVEVVTTLARGLAAAEDRDEGTRQACLERERELAAMVHYHEVFILAEWATERLEETVAWWRIDAEGQWHQPPEEPRQPVKGAANQRVLTHLAGLRQDEPGVCADTDALAAAGWPGERLVAKAAGNRVRVALSTLRSAGLTSLIERGEDGWRLASTRPVRSIGG